MRTSFTRSSALLAAVASLSLLAGCERPPVEPRQQGFRGTGMVEMTNPRTAEAVKAANKVPDPQPPVPAGSPPASSVYKNVPVLGDLGVAEFTRLMVAITAWVSPEQGCNYCHAGEDFASDKVYTKVVARRMLEMTREINSGWTAHVGETGVTCYTCHRGNPVPPAVWFAEPPQKQAGGLTALRGGQNAPATAVGLTSLPIDPFSPYLRAKENIRVVSATALPAGPGQTIQATEGTYGLMMHISQGLGVNCTYCHNTRSFAEWDQSSPQRATAWHGLRMVHTLNAQFLDPLKPQYPANRLGPLGDAAKANCTTCHQGVAKPLYGVSMLKDHPELRRTPAPAPKVEAAPAPAAAPPSESK